ncbi:hypothetical protein SeMB42_g01564 [Synchytrium endobioticum]|uniref:DEK-C domain-containing protein n=1 Tax=Synchytrium endobioticum TaxID=286115 RepID=A0A507DCN7_9FUNG|nr:hypothetical protein SeLEV6574_g01440 [Synchytrium endobioticum]TPX52222.1 hypothetical protein SeMB42_g01564 [Synchytrium endobioticum]
MLMEAPKTCPLVKPCPGNALPRRGANKGTSKARKPSPSPSAIAATRPTRPSNPASISPSAATSPGFRTTPQRSINREHHHPHHHRNRSCSSRNVNTSIANLHSMSSLASQTVASCPKRKRGRPPSAATLAARAAGIIGPHESLSSRGISTSQISITQYEVDSADEDNANDCVNSNGKRIRSSITLSELPPSIPKRKRGRPPKQKTNSAAYSKDDVGYDSAGAIPGGMTSARRFYSNVHLNSDGDDDVCMLATDQRLVDEINRMLKGSDLSSLSNNIVRQRLENTFRQDLTHRRPFINQQIDRYLDAHPLLIV